MAVQPNLSAPVDFVVSELKTVTGSRMALQLNTVHGTAVYGMTPDQARAIAVNLIKCADKIEFGLTIAPASRLTGLHND